MLSPLASVCVCVCARGAFATCTYARHIDQFRGRRILRYPPTAEIEEKLNSKIEAVRPGAVRAAAHEVPAKLRCVRCAHALKRAVMRRCSTCACTEAQCARNGAC